MIAWWHAILFSAVSAYASYMLGVTRERLRHRHAWREYGRTKSTISTTWLLACECGSTREVEVAGHEVTRQAIDPVVAELAKGLN